MADWLDLAVTGIEAGILVRSIAPRVVAFARWSAMAAMGYATIADDGQVSARADQQLLAALRRGAQ